MRTCSKCGELKPETEFYAEKTCKDGLRPDCKACHAARGKSWYARNRDKAIADVRRWQQENPDRLREYRLKNRDKRALQMRKLHLRRTFGMTIEDYDALLAAQDGGCAICGDQPIEGQSLHVDHHTDGVRGILCVRCNNGLGQFKDDPELMVRAAEYTTLGGFAPLWLVRREIGGAAS
jgi:Autographiviridae endonuclease VII